MLLALANIAGSLALLASLVWFCRAAIGTGQG
jgi:hypothetical protein